MGMIPIDSLETGMVLASNVNDRTGRLLLGSGVELTQKHLIVLRTWGIEEADIEGVEGEAVTMMKLPADVTPDELRAAEEDLKRRHFRHAGLDHPAVRELLRLAALRKVHHGNAPTSPDNH